MISTDLYGFKHDDMEKACVVVESALSTHLEPHDSLHFGEYYLGRLSGERNKSVHLEHSIDPPN